MKSKILLFVVLILFSGSAFAAADQIQIILDASGSMKEQLDGRPKIDIARESLNAVIQKIPVQSHIGLRAFGHKLSHKDPNTCTDTELLMSIGPLNREKLISTVNALTVRGETPIAYSLKKAADDFAPDVQKTVVLLSDGKETCGGDPVAVIAELKKRGIDLKVHVIGFAVDDTTAAQLKAISDASGGKYFAAKDASQLTNSFQKAVTVAPPPPAPTPTPKPKEDPLVNLIGAENGGQIITASADIFSKLIDGKENSVYWFKAGNEGVYAFQGEQMGTIHAVAVPIYKTYGNNIASFDVYVSTTSPADGFTKVGTYSPKNLKMFKSVFQEFKIDPPVPAKYVKLVIGKSAKGSDSSELFEFRVLGKLGGDAPTTQPTTASAPPPTQDLINLLDPGNGGQIITGSADIFAKLIDGKENSVYWFKTGQEGVYAFKDEKEATIHKIAIPIYKTYGNNIGSLDVFVSTTSPADGFTKVTTISPKNMKMFQSVFQEFQINPPVKAKYIKIVIGKSAKGSDSSELFELKVFGKQ